MAINFPTSLDSLTNPNAGDGLNSPSHSGQHADANDAIEALEAKVGANSSAVTTSHDYKITKLEEVVNNASASAAASIDLAEDTDNGTNKITLTAPSSVASDKTLTLPDATDTLVGKDTTDTLTNKTLTAPVLNGALSGDAKATGATITTGTADDEFVTPKALADATVGKLGAAWSTWTPSFTNLTVGNGTLSAKYIQIGKTVIFRLDFVLGSTSSMGNAQFTLPVTAASYTGTAGQHDIGTGTFTDTGTAGYPATCHMLSTTEAKLYAQVTSASYLSFASPSSSIPFTWTTGDEYHAFGIYEAA